MLGLKYKVPVKGTGTYIEIWVEGYVGSIIVTAAINEAITLTSSIEKTVNSKVLEFSLATTSRKQWIELFNVPPQNVRVKLYANDRLRFDGILENEAYNESFEQSALWATKLTAHEGFSKLKSIDSEAFINSTYSYATMHTLIWAILEGQPWVEYSGGLKVNLQFDEKILKDGTLGTITGRLLEKEYLSIYAHFKNKSEYLDCYSLLENILNRYDCFIRKEGSVVIIERRADYAMSTKPYIHYLNSSDSGSVALGGSLTHDITDVRGGGLGRENGLKRFTIKESFNKVENYVLPDFEKDTQPKEISWRTGDTVGDRLLPMPYFGWKGISKNDGGGVTGFDVDGMLYSNMETNVSLQLARSANGNWFKTRIYVTEAEFPTTEQPIDTSIKIKYSVNVGNLFNTNCGVMVSCGIMIKPKYSTTPFAVEKAYTVLDQGAGHEDLPWTFRHLLAANEVPVRCGKVYQMDSDEVTSNVLEFEEDIQLNDLVNKSDGTKFQWQEGEHDLYICPCPPLKKVGSSHTWAQEECYFEDFTVTVSNQWSARGNTTDYEIGEDFYTDTDSTPIELPSRATSSIKGNVSRLNDNGEIIECSDYIDANFVGLTYSLEDWRGFWEMQNKSKPKDVASILVKDLGIEVCDSCDFGGNIGILRVYETKEEFRLENVRAECVKFRIDGGERFE